MSNKRGTRQRRGAAINTGSMPRPGEQPREAKRYRYTPNRPAKDAVYTVDGTEHRFDGRCHRTCPDVR